MVISMDFLLFLCEMSTIFSQKYTYQSFGLIFTATYEKEKMIPLFFTETCFDKKKDCADLDPLTRFCSDFKDQCKETCNSCGKYVTLLVLFLSAQS